MEEQRRNNGEAFQRVEEGFKLGGTNRCLYALFGPVRGTFDMRLSLDSRSDVQASRLSDAPRPRKNHRNSRNRIEST